MSGIFVGEFFYDSTNKICKICSSPVWDAYGDFYVCLKCKKNLSDKDVLKQNPYNYSSVVVGYYGQENNNELKYIVDSTGNTMIFKNVFEAKNYLIDCGLVKKTIYKNLNIELYHFNDFYFIDQVQEGCYVK